MKPDILPAETVTLFAVKPVTDEENVMFTVVVPSFVSEVATGEIVGVGKVTSPVSSVTVPKTLLDHNTLNVCVASRFGLIPCGLISITAIPDSRSPAAIRINAETVLEPIRVNRDAYVASPVTLM